MSETDSKGPRRVVGVRLGTDTLLKLRIVAANRGLSRNALIVEILEDAAEERFNAIFGGLAEALEAEKARRETTHERSRA